MFNPSKDQVRDFFCVAWKKHQDSGVLTPLESIAARWMVEHPEYHQLLNHPEEAKSQDFSVENGQTNPFLHLSMHMSLSEQTQIDQPVGIRKISRQLMMKLDSEHSAHHQMMECLGRVLWESSQTGSEPNMQSYIEELQLLI
jgi:Domain of unknown function (DUF1841)